MICFGGTDMFYDERIENIKGKIAHNSIFISFLLSLALGSVHLINIIKNAPSNKYLWLVSLEFVICIATLTVLIIGFIKSKLQVEDERTKAEKNLFYNRSVKYLIGAILIAFACLFGLIINLEMPHNFADQGFGSILYVLFFVIGIYVVYSFKSNDIYFNYSIMDSGHYYKGVFKNIGKMGLYTLSLFLLAMIFFIIGMLFGNANSSLNVKNLTYIVIYFVISFLELAVIYLLYSFLEKCSYNIERSISKSTIISLAITVFIYVVYTAGVIFVDSTGISQATIVQIVSIISTLDTYIKFAFLLFLTYFEYEYQRICKNKLVSAACITIILGEILSVVMGQVSNSLVFVFMPEIMSQDAYAISRILSVLNLSIENISNIANSIGLVFVVFALVKDKAIHQIHRFVACASVVVLVGLELFLRTQIDVLSVSIYHFIAEIAALCYLCVIVWRVKGKAQKETDKIPWKA